MFGCWPNEVVEPTYWGGSRSQSSVKLRPSPLSRKLLKLPALMFWNQSSVCLSSTSDRSGGPGAGSGGGSEKRNVCCA